MKLNEIGPMPLRYHGFAYGEEVDREDDNEKIWHYIRVPGEPKSRTLDYSPYAIMDTSTFKAFVDFYERMGYFPTREDVPSAGPIHKEDMSKLLAKAQAKQ